MYAIMARNIHDGNICPGTLLPSNYLGDVIYRKGFKTYEFLSLNLSGICVCLRYQNNYIKDCYNQWEQLLEEGNYG